MSEYESEGNNAKTKTTETKPNVSPTTNETKRKGLIAV